MIGKIFRTVKEYGKIFIFGAGESGIEMYMLLKKCFPESTIVFLDNDRLKQNEGIVISDSHVNVVSPHSLKEIKGQFVVLITSTKYANELISQLKSIGVSYDNMILTDECHKKFYEYMRNYIARRTPKKKFSFVVDLAEHCNLNCQMCDHFSPLAEPFFTDIEEFERDIKRMSEIFDDEITHIDLEGGEPLLNPYPHEYVKIVRKYFKETNIQIFTNGLLLSNMKEEFWNVCKEEGVILEVTQYPIKFNYDKMRDLSESKGVEYRVYNGEGVKESWYKPLDLDGEQDKYNSFVSCYMANGECAMLKKGKLYPCTVVANVSTFNRYFGKNLCVGENDYIDIYDNVDKEKIFDFMCNPIPACRYCKVKERTGGHTWKVSRKVIEEWI